MSISLKPAHPGPDSEAGLHFGRDPRQIGAEALATLQTAGVTDACRTAAAVPLWAPAFAGVRGTVRLGACRASLGVWASADCDLCGAATGERCRAQEMVVATSASPTNQAA